MHVSTDAVDEEVVFNVEFGKNERKSSSASVADVAVAIHNFSGYNADCITFVTSIT